MIIVNINNNCSSPHRKLIERQMYFPVAEDAEVCMADSRFEILNVLRSFDESGRPAPPTAQIAALTRQRMTAATAMLGELQSSGDIKLAGQDNFEITNRGRTSLARAERDGNI